ncbi:NAD(P)-dependent oxidoreductase [Microbacterium rhizophilus]|uniref:NAD(P)-dependent oxidoreductase n=1 Tax=Microbacterium rhizophilus TaxID=3138934 RepID=UPI0031EC1547
MSDASTRIALIGLGNMGGPIGSQWIAAGTAVTGFDLSADARAGFEKRGGTTAETAAAATAGADVVVLLLPDSRIVDAVLDDLTASGALAASSVVIDMSSSEPEHTQRNARRLAELGIRFIDAPVSGGVRGAETAALTVMVGGTGETVEEMRPLLERLGTVIHVGDAGAGHAVKALNNLLSAVHLWATSEAVLVAERFGIDPETTLRVVNGSSGRSGSSEVKWPKFILTESYDSGFAAQLMLKDARIATGLAAAVGTPTRLGEQLVDEWSRAVDALPAGADHTEIARFLRETAEKAQEGRS